MEKEIEKLVSKWEKELRELEKEYEKYYLNGTYIHASRLSGRKTQLITCLVQLKNLKPNELRAVNRNEAQRELLISFEQWKYDHDIKNLLPEQTVDFYLDEINND